VSDSCGTEQLKTRSFASNLLPDRDRRPGRSGRPKLLRREVADGRRKARAAFAAAIEEKPAGRFMIRSRTLWCSSTRRVISESVRERRTPAAAQLPRPGPGAVCGEPLDQVRSAMQYCSNAHARDDFAQANSVGKQDGPMELSGVIEVVRRGKVIDTSDPNPGNPPTG
jgi:hypothetical protein